MRNRTTLSLIELSVMLLVFALTATLCMAAFVWAHETADAYEMRDHALLQAQNTAEVLKFCGADAEKAAQLSGGTWKDGLLTAYYDKQWAQTDHPDTYTLIVRPGRQETKFLRTAEILVLHGETRLIQMDVAWQEVNSHG